MTQKPENTFLKLLCIIPFFLGCVVFVQAQAPVADFTASPTSGCAPLRVTFTDQSSGNPTSWSWDFGNGQLSTVQNPTVNFSQPGVYTVRLVVKNDSGINDKIKTDFITVFQPPKALFTANLTTSCAPAAIQFTDQSTSAPGSSISSWSWNFGDGTTSSQQSPSHTYTSPGYYTVSLKVTSSTGCQNTYTVGRYIRIVSGITVGFAFDQPSTCQSPFLVNFHDQSSGPGVLSYSWDLGNGSNATVKNPSSIYATAGTYPVHLVVESNLGCKDSLTKNITIEGKTTDFNFPAAICVAQSVNFQNNSSPAPISSTWDFGDGTISSQINPVKTFLTGGTYQVKLINNYGNCIDSVTKAVTVITLPTVDFSADDSTLCNAPFTVQFKDDSPAASTWMWDFGDGSTSTEQNPTHTYANPGSYDVTLSITLAGGCNNTITKTQFINVQPTEIKISNAPANGCVPFTYSPVATVQSVDGIISYLWDFGDGATSTSPTPTHTYNAVGNYDLTLTVTNASGCVQTLIIPRGVKVGTKPIADFSFTPDNVCASTPIQFTDGSTGTSGAVDDWNWDFGDGTNSTLKNPTHIFEDTGTLTVQLTVSSSGCPDMISKTITVLPPVAKFDYAINCSNHLNVTFTNNSLAVSPAYEWDFGDGSPIATDKNPTHIYSTLGVYTVTLTVTDGACSYNTSKTITLVDEPVDFSIDKNPVCKNDPFTLSAVISNPSNIQNYTWTIGTNTLSNHSQGVQYNIANVGSYDVTLVTEDINGCTNSKTVSNYIKVNGPVAKFVPSSPGNCINKPVTFTDLSTPGSGTPITEWTWNFGDGSTQTFTSPPFTHNYAGTGNYSVSLTVKDIGNCTDKYSVSNAVLITHPIAGFRADTVFCPQVPLQFADTSIGVGLTYEWNFGDGSAISNLQNPLHSYPAGDSLYTVTLKIKDLAGCEDSVAKIGYIKTRSPKAAFDVVDSSGICLPLVTSFTFKGSDYKSFYWDFGDGTTTTALNPAHFYNLYGTYTPKLYLTGPGGCMDSAEAIVHAYNPTTDTHISTGPTTACNSLNVDFNMGVPPGFKYTFFFGDGSLDSSGQPTLTHLYAAPGNYSSFLTYTDKYGCQPSVNVSTIHVYGALPLFDKNRKEFCDTGVVQFKNFTLSNDPITSTIWDFGDGSTSTGSSPSHFFASPGTYKVQLIVSTQNNCTSVYADTIRVYRTPSISILAKDTICVNSTENYSGIISQPDSTVQWQWIFQNGSSSQAQNPDVLYSATGDYGAQLIAINKLGCADTAQHSVNVVPLPTATPTANPITIISGGSGQLNMNYTGPIVSYNWLPVQNLSCIDCPQPIASPHFTTDYSVTVQDRYGCVNTGGITVQVVCNGQNFFIPNTFSPNGDGINDVFYLRGTGLFRVSSMMIFDRWGEIVFQKKDFSVNDPLAGWDGNYKGKKAKPDVYVYQVEIICGNGETIKYSGNVALIQ